MQEDEDYWHWRVQSTARREVLRLAQILCHSAALATPAALEVESFLQVVGNFFTRVGNDSLVNSLQKLRALEPPAVPADLENWIDEHRLQELAQAACDIFALTVAALERRERVLEDLRRELAKNARQLSQLREQETQDFLKSEELREQLQEVRSRLSASEYERGRHLPALQSMVSDLWRDVQAQLQAKEALVERLQAEIKDLSVSLRGQEIESRQHEQRHVEVSGLLRRSQQTVTQLREQRSHMQQERDELRQLLVQAEASRDRARAGEARLEKEVVELRRHNTALQENLAETQRGVRELEQAERSAHQKLEQLNLQLQRQAEELATLSTLGEHCCNLELLLSQKSEEQDQLAMALNEAQNRANRLEDALRLLRERSIQKLSDKDQQAAQLEFQLREAQRRLAHYEGPGKNEREQLLGWGTQLENELKQARQNLADQRHWALAMEEREKATQSELISVRSEFLAAQAELKEWQLRCQELTQDGLPQELADTKERLEKSQETCLKLRDLVLSARAEQARLQADLERVRQELSEERLHLQEAAHQAVSQQEAHLTSSHQSDLEVRRLRQELAQSRWQQQALADELESQRERQDEQAILEQMLVAEQERNQQLLAVQERLRARLEELETRPRHRPGEPALELPGAVSFQEPASAEDEPLWLSQVRAPNNSLEDPLLLPYFRF